LPSEFISCKSIDTVTNENEIVNYPTEFLNSLKLPGFPPNNLRLKINSPTILLWNINAPIFYNETRLIIKKIMGNVIEATILNGKFRYYNVLLSRIPILFTDVLIQFKYL